MSDITNGENEFTADGQIEELMIECLEMVRSFDVSPGWAHGLKLGEECGEVQEAILVAAGMCDHKEIKEDVMHEVADVINVCMAILSAEYETVPINELLPQLVAAMQLKNTKYANIIGVYGD